jgi:tetrahedral aminopeptidase
MDAESLEFLDQLLLAPSPSGYEQPVQKVVREFAGRFADEVRTDWHGNVIAAVNPTGSPRIMLAGHCDQIGLIVKYIDDRGFVWVETIGGWDTQMLVGQQMVVWGRNGAVPGVIGKKPIHLLTPEDRKKVPEIKDLWIDLGTASRVEAEELVAVGDPVTFHLGRRDLQNGLACAPAMDNKVGAWTVLSALQRVAAAKPKAAVFAVSTVQEEIGLRGAQTSAFSIDPALAIVVDVTHATDCPTLEVKQFGDIKLGAGPVLYRGPNVNPGMHRRLGELAAAGNLPTQIGALGKSASNDANSIQITRGGIATAIVAIPNRYMHSPVEMVSLADLDHAAELIAQFCCDLTPESDFTPA